MEDTRFRHLWYFPWFFFNLGRTNRILVIYKQKKNLLSKTDLLLKFQLLWNSLPSQLFRGFMSSVGLQRTVQRMIGSNELQLIWFILTILLEVFCGDSVPAFAFYFILLGKGWLHITPYFSQYCYVQLNFTSSYLL